MGRVDEWWARALNVAVQRFIAGGIIAADHLDHVGTLALRPHGTLCIYGPRELTAQLPRRLAFASFDEVVHGCSLARALGGRAVQTLGPAWYGYATSGTLTGRKADAVRRLDESDRQFIAAFRKDVPPREWMEAGMDDGPLYGYWLDGRLVSGANLGSWRGTPTLGVLTLPAHRGRGFGRAVVAAAARDALNGAAHVQYRARTSNPASIALAHDAGFVHYRDALVLDLSDQSSAGVPSRSTATGSSSSSSS